MDSVDEKFQDNVINMDKLGPSSMTESPLLKTASPINHDVPTNDLKDHSVGEALNAYLDRQRANCCESIRSAGPYDCASFAIPSLKWLRTYNVRENLASDVLAGISVGAMVVPQGMSYAKLAGLPQQLGLYSAFIPPIVYSMFGSSRQLSVGPTAVISILVGSSLGELFGGSPCDTDTFSAGCTEYVTAAIQIALLSGVITTIMGIFGLGWISYFLSHSIISGFMSGAAILIGLSQSKYILGLDIDRAHNVVEYLHEIFSNMDQFNWREFLMGMSFITLLLTTRTLSRNVKKLAFLRSVGPLLVCTLSISLMSIYNWDTTLDENGRPYIKSIGSVPAGLPAATINMWGPMDYFSSKLSTAVVICAMGVCESLSIAKACATKYGYKVDAAQDLRALGFANIFGSMFGAFPITGSFSRSAVTDSQGGKSLISSLVVGLVVMCTLLFLTTTAERMSSNVQGAIIIVGVVGLVQVKECIHLWHVSKFDCLVWTVTFILTLFVGVEQGILGGVFLSLALIVYKTAFPRIITLGQLPGTTIYRSIKMYPQAKAPNGMVILRINASIYFANCEGIRDYLEEHVLPANIKVHKQKGDEEIKYLIIDLSPSPDIDVAGVHMFEKLIADLEHIGITLILANPTNNVLRKLRRAKVLDSLGLGVQVSVYQAVKYARAHLKKANPAEGRSPASSMKAPDDEIDNVNHSPLLLASAAEEAPPAIEVKVNFDAFAPAPLFTGLRPRPFRLDDLNLGEDPSGANAEPEFEFAVYV